MSDINEIMKELAQNVADILKDNYKGLESLIKQDTQSFLTESEEDIKTWAKNLADNEITEKEFELLVKSKGALLKLSALKAQGETDITLDKIKNEIIGAVVTSVIKMI